MAATRLCNYSTPYTAVTEAHTGTCLPSVQLLGQEPELSTFLTALNATGIAVCFLPPSGG